MTVERVLRRWTVLLRHVVVVHVPVRRLRVDVRLLLMRRLRVLVLLMVHEVLLMVMVVRHADADADADANARVTRTVGAQWRRGGRAARRARSVHGHRHRLWRQRRLPLDARRRAALATRTASAAPAAVLAFLALVDPN